MMKLFFTTIMSTKENAWRTQHGSKIWKEKINVRLGTTAARECYRKTLITDYFNISNPKYTLTCTKIPTVETVLALTLKLTSSVVLISEFGGSANQQQ